MWCEIEWVVWGRKDDTYSGSGLASMPLSLLEAVSSPPPRISAVENWRTSSTRGNLTLVSIFAAADVCSNRCSTAPNCQLLFPLQPYP